MKYLFISLFIASLLLVGVNAFAQENADVTADENITAQDLEISEPTVLPNNPFYSLKEIWRDFRTNFALTPLKRAELRLRFANERLVEAQKLAEQTNNEEILKKIIEKYQQEIEKLKAQIEKFREKAKDNPKIDKFLDKLTEKIIKQETLLEGLEKKLSDKPELLQKIQEAKERALERFSEIINRLEEKEGIKERLEKNLERIEGGKYKNFKNLEFLLELENKVPEQAKEAIRQAQENALKRLHGDLNNMSPEDQVKFKDYLEKISGDKNTQLQILERLQKEKSSSTLKTNLNQIQQKIKERIKNSKESCKNLCGDGICQEIVCMAIGCPCAETKTTCPQDCK